MPSLPPLLNCQTCESRSVWRMSCNHLEADLHHFCIDIDNTIAQTDEVMRRVIADFTKGRVKLDYDGIVTFNYHECRDQHGNQITKAEWKQVHDLFSEPMILM